MGNLKTKVVYKNANLVYNCIMIYSSNSNYIVDFSNNRFILFNTRHRSEEVISNHQASRLDSDGFAFTAAAKNELEEMHYEEAMHHYVG